VIVVTVMFSASKENGAAEGDFLICARELLKALEGILETRLAVSEKDTNSKPGSYHLQHHISWPPYREF